MPRPLLLIATLGLAALAAAQGRLPVERITTARGLVYDRVTHLLTDSRGFLWIGTRDGVSRFDGERFVNYTTDDGLPHRFITTMMESRGGALYFATAAGLARLDPGAVRGRDLFTVIGRGVQVNDVVEDRNGALWAACGDALCRVDGTRLQRDPAYSGAMIHILALSRTGELWAGTKKGLARRRANGTWERYAVQPHRGDDTVHGLSIDARGRLWIGTGFGFFVADPAALRSPLIDHLPFTRLTTPDHPLVFTKTAVHIGDTAWIPTSRGVAVVDAGGVRVLDQRDGLFTDGVNAIAADPAGNLWIGADMGGLMRVARSGVTTFTREHGLLHDRINSIFETDRGVCATSGATRFLQCFDGDRIRAHTIIPPSVAFTGWGWGDVVARDRNGEWWVATGQGVIRWSADLRRVIATYDTTHGLGGNDVFRVWRDSRGDLWFSTFGARVLTRREHATGRFITYGEAEGMPLVAPTAFAEDRRGNVFIGLYTGGVLRFDGKRFTRLTGALPADFVHDLFFDSRGTLWVAANDGLARIPGGMVARRGALALAETADGRIVIGSRRGVELRDPRSGHIVRVSTADGLPHNEVVAAHRDRSGTLWFATASGLARVTRLPDLGDAAPPRPRIHLGPELGTHAAGPLRLRYPDHRIAITFSAPDFDPRSPLQFEYRLAGDDTWTPALARRSVAYERLPFGSQRFEVRSIGANGKRSAPATLAMDIIPPVWRRPWFAAIVIVILIAVPLLLHRLRVAHLLALQEMRMRVATDLHDDLGSSLSRISILSEVAKRRANERVLDEIGDTARSLVDALGDSIWAIDPRRDDLQSVFSRVRHFAAGVLEAKSMTLDLDIPPSLGSLTLTPEKRREVFLILKEAINNAAKHSQATRVAVAASLDDARLRLRIADDGVGFEKAGEGHGLPSMAARAQRAGGRLSIHSKPGAGTRIEVEVAYP